VSGSDAAVPSDSYDSGPATVAAGDSWMVGFATDEVLLPEPLVSRAAAALSDLQRRHWTVATAESVTGGLVCAALVEVPGASASVAGGVVAYETTVKSSVLGVPRALLEEKGPVHSTTAAAMARHARLLLGSDVGIATTGVAGPQTHGGAPVGRVFVAVDARGGRAKVRRIDVPGSRSEIRRAAAEEALDLLQWAAQLGPRGSRADPIERDRE